MLWMFIFSFSERKREIEIALRKEQPYLAVVFVNYFLLEK